MPVRNQVVSNYEKVEYIDVDGNRYNLHNPYKSAVLSMSGWGMMDPEVATTRSPYQHGETPISIQYSDRRVSMTWFYRGCSRADYWAGREWVIDALRLNKTNLLAPDSGTLKWFRADGTIRALKCMLTSGPDFPQGSKEWSSYYASDKMVFTAHDPGIFDPELMTVTLDDLACVPTGELKFPITFDGITGIVFGEDFCTDTENFNIDYTEATFHEYPVIEIDGPVSGFRLTNTTNNTKLELDYTIPLGTTVTINTNPVNFYIQDDDVPPNDLYYTLTEDSNDGYFRLDPGVVNTLELYTESGTVASEVRINYYIRYIGI